MAVPKRKQPAGRIESLGEFEASLDRALDQAETNPESLAGYAPTTDGNPINLGPRVPEADQWAEKMVTNAANAGSRWLAGVKAPRKNPIEAAKAAQNKWANKVREAIEQGRFAAGLDNVDLDEMYAIIEAGGETPYTSGVRRREGKVRRVVSELRNQVLALAQELDKMPTDTAEQREAKMIAAKRGMEAIGRRRRGRR